MFKLDILELNENLDIIKKDVKVLYNTDELTPASKWVREDVKGLKTFDGPQISSATIVKEYGRGTIVNGALGYLLTNANNVGNNVQHVALFTGACSKANGLSVIHKNFYKCLNLFTARKLIFGDWVNWCDEYMVPNEQHELFEQFKYDSIIYSLFNSKSNQSSLRQVTYKNKLWDIKNEFFWISKDTMKSLGDKHGYDELYNDVRTDSDRYVHKLLFGQERIYDKLSPDAKLVLDKATELVEKSMDVRKLISDDTNHLNSWDAGYAQLKLVWKEYFSDEFKEFRQLYKNMEDRMRPLVYELGFLIK
jgi:hypothetical protein